MNEKTSPAILHLKSAFGLTPSRINKKQIDARSDEAHIKYK